ncbi:hypothetical protein PV325_008632 [Microctonus aethiopoides]|uniref:ZZ-type zinc finger-containing protein 3 n=2 Tax=Microctonus aethiopoides TaxID=144406 RepID=A0AA39C790_9HYME|nr:hypothetical protein PV325_008632 [Microctonus aethiopoides]KAK0097190.1 hypothetical protein PV326_003004 [Microctonus aethiopoides]KAK0159219.1 hypothetical protein PV328_010129 [Microctonus aethiopoides]
MEKADIDCDIESNEFYFESDHLALKGNKDYTTLLKTVVLLESQRAQALKDLDELLACRTKAMKDPISFVAQLQNSDLPNLPGPRKITEIPYIDWSRYNIIETDNRIRPQTRHGNFIPQIKTKNTEADDGKILVRGRAFDESKPETFNQLWTVEEQKRLDELLIEYPPEEVEMRRWTKIANALGNRTPKQVSSRVQKYFLKLNRARLPVPGRGPKAKLDVKKSLHHRHQRNNYLLFRKSTFFPGQDYVVDDKDECEMVRDHSMTVDDSENDISNGVDEIQELKQIELIRRIREEKAQGHTTLYQHFGYKCTICEEDPLKGTRWNCMECSTVNLCNDCVIAQIESVNPLHPPNHKLKSISMSDNLKTYDTDYFPQNFDNSSNYLDPNFCPE